MNTPRLPDGSESQPATVLSLIRPPDQLRYFQHDTPFVKLTALIITNLGRILAGGAFLAVAICKVLQMLN